MGYLRNGLVFETLPEDWPTFRTAGYIAYGVPACAGMLKELGDVHVSVDDGFATSNYIHSFLAWRVGEELRRLGGDPLKYRALRLAYGNEAVERDRTQARSLG